MPEITTKTRKPSAGLGGDRASAHMPAEDRSLQTELLSRVRGMAGRILDGGHPLREKVLVGGAAVAGIIFVVYLLGIPQWMKQHRENRQWVVVNKLTPESLIRRCGPPVSDETKDLYPVITRDVSYRAEPGGTVVLKFSRTAEEQSDWVFMSMQDSATGAAYETPVAKISALSCLDSSK